MTMTFVSGQPIEKHGVTYFPLTPQERDDIFERGEKRELALIIATYCPFFEGSVKVTFNGRIFQFRYQVPPLFFGEYVSPPIRPLTDIMGTFAVTIAGIVFCNNLYDVTDETVREWERLAAPSPVDSSVATKGVAVEAALAAKAAAEKAAVEAALAAKAAAEKAAAEKAAAEKAAAEKAAAEKAAAEAALAAKAAAEKAAAEEKIFLAALETLTACLAEQALDEAVSEIVKEVEYLEELEREEAEKRRAKIIAKARRDEEEKEAEISSNVSAVLDFILKKVCDEVAKLESIKKKKEKKAAKASARKEREDAERAAFEEAKAANAAIAVAAAPSPVAAAAPSPVAAAAPSPVAAAAPSPVAAAAPSPIAASSIVERATAKKLKISDTKRDLVRAKMDQPPHSKMVRDLDSEFRRLTDERIMFTNLVSIALQSGEVKAAYGIFVENELLPNGEEIEMFTFCTRKCEVEKKVLETPPEEFVRLLAASVTMFAKNSKKPDQSEMLKIGGWISALSIFLFETKRTFRVEEAFYAFAREIVSLLEPCRQTCFAEISSECLNFLDKIFDAK
jgi:hypothetical protein